MPHQVYKSMPRSGFTLIEMSIVLVIIGLIVGSFLTGKDLINTAGVRSRIGKNREELLHNLIADIYLTTQRITAAALIRETRHRCQLEGIRPPSESTIAKMPVNGLLGLDDACGCIMA
jgi:prepilin-type N-terminal cleavage/methylation domain-containing protein